MRMPYVLFTALLGGGLVGLMPAAAADAGAGKAVYTKKCQTCHGAQGQGNQGMAKALKAEIRHLGSAEVQKKSDGDLKKDITQGVGKMKPVADLSTGDTDNVVAFVRTLKQ
jgi:mono/diheme cytochrome c family protein